MARLPTDDPDRDHAATEVYDPYPRLRQPPPGAPVAAPFPSAVPSSVAAVGSEPSAPIRVISMKEPSAPVRVHEPRAHQVQLRALAEVARRDTPAPTGHLAPPRDAAVRAVRTRQMRGHVLWLLGGAVLAGAIASSIWLIAGRA
jgi:hypothetical protein